MESQRDGPERVSGFGENRFKIDAETDTEAESWARRRLYDAVTTLLPDWRLDRLDFRTAP